MSGRSFKGDILIGFYQDGVFKGFLPEILNVSELTFTPPEVETQNRISHKREDDGQTLDSFDQTTGSSTMSLSTDEQIPDILALTFLGDSVELDITAGTVTGEEVTVYHDRWVKLEHINLDEGAPFDADDGDAETYTEDTDYEVDYRRGMIRALEGGTIGDGDTIEVDYEFTAITGYEIVGHTNQSVRCQIFGDMEDRVTGKRGELEVYDWRVRPSDAANIMDPENFLTSALEGTLVKPSGKSGPFRFRQIEDAS
ncbi:MAG: hypothetical protein ACOC8P_00540 [Dichotomicrobium sp.]